MTSTASSSISSRVSVEGQASPKMCSLSASPVPMPKEKRPFSITLDVAAAWAMIAGWMRTVGQVTPVVTGSEVAWDSPPITLHTNGELPCSWFHGWKWSEIHNASKPAASAILACSISWLGPNSSQDKKYPNFVKVSSYRSILARLARLDPYP